MRSTLVYCAPAPVSDAALGFRLDVKFVEGMRAHARAWGGPVTCVLWRGADAIPFGRSYLPGDLGFDLIVLDPGQSVPLSAYDDAALASVSLDMTGFDRIVRQAKAAAVPVVVALEYTLETRLRILWMDRHAGFARRLRRTLWQLQHERRLRATLRAADGAQFNGYPALDGYAEMAKSPLLYLDNPMTPDLLATRAQMAARAETLRSGAPLRLIHSGRLEPMKGAQDLLPVMAALKAQGVAATLDIFAAGSLEAQIRAGLPAFDGAVRLHAPVDFETELVPYSREQADVFLSCHRQSDPSCTYLEAMGCGLAVAGYANRMWSRLSAESGAGAVVPLGDVSALAHQIARWSENRENLIASADAGLAFARAHDFHAEFSRRMDHLHACSGKAPAL